MKKLSELTRFYYENLHPVLEDLDKKREEVKFRVMLFGGFILLIDLMSFSFFQNNLDILLFTNIVVGAFLYKFLTKDYTKEFKDRVIKPLISAIDENLKYAKNAHVRGAKFINSGIFTQMPDKIEGNDYISGAIDDINIELSDIHAQKEHRNSKGRTSWSTIFQGLFIVSQFNKNFQGKTVILPDCAQNAFGGLIGNWLQSHNINRNELIKMDNPEFEKEFVVYGSDQIEARYILNHTLMERLLEFKKKTKHKLYVSFVFEQIFIAIDYGKDLFEPAVFRTLLDYKVAMEYVQTLHLAIGVVKELKLNEKLWSKV
ncbi:MAG: DUF3137 domain-containing protein [Epsilonproteobacteria bacterium]|nr:DUF3137 domain-containing protein [Campylobacterota bacterium]